MANGLGELTYLDDDLGQWAVRGDYRLRANTGNDLQKLVNGQWQNFMPAGGDYDPRTEGHVIDSNERRRFLQGFLSAPVGFDINSGGMQGIATAQGWQEPDRSGGSGFGDFLTHFALPAAAMAFGIPALTGAGGAGLAGGAISSEAAALGMGGIDAAGWGSGALDVLGAGSGGGLSWLGNEGLATLPEAVGALPGAEGVAALEGLELGGEGVGQALNTVSETVNRPSWFQELLNPVTNPNQTFAPWANADPSLPFGSEEWLRSAGQGTSMLNGQTINLLEWIAANPQAAAAIGAKAPGFFEKLLQSFSDNKSTASSVGKLLGLGDTASSLLGLGTKLLSGLDLVRRNRQALNTNDQRLRDSKDATPLSATSFNMLRPTALRRAKGGLVQMAEGGSPLEKARTELREWLKGVEMPMTNRSNVLAGLEQPRYATPDEIVSMLDAPFKVGEDGEKSYYPRRQLRGPMPVHDTYRRAMHDIGYPVGINGIIPTDQSLEFDDAMQGHAKGGLAQCAECGAGSSTPRYVQGGTSGQSDKIPALLSDGEYVFDADSVAALGDGNNAAGAAALDQMRQNIRKHKRSAPPTKIPPKAKRPEHYLKGAK